MDEEKDQFWEKQAEEILNKEKEGEEATLDYRIEGLPPELFRAVINAENFKAGLESHKLEITVAIQKLTSFICSSIIGKRAIFKFCGLIYEEKVYKITREGIIMFADEKELFVPFSDILMIKDSLDD